MLLSTPFLTALDPRARVKGSRDPLGFVPLWSSLGREVVGNLTTVTTSVRNFTTTLLCQHLAEELVAGGRAREDERCSVFLRAEQLFAYCRVAHAAGDAEGRVLGIQRVKERLGGRQRQLTLSERAEHQILSDQRVYGLWGLYTVASRSSGLLEPGHHRPTPLAHDHLEREVLDRLPAAVGPDLRKVLRLLTGGASFSPRGADRALAEALASTVAPRLRPAERAFYEETLLLGGPDAATGGRQARLAVLLRQLNGKDGPFSWGDGMSMAEAQALARLAAEAGDDALARPLSIIRDVEPVLAAATYLFDFLLDREGLTLDEAARHLGERWPGGLAHVDVEAVEAARSPLEAGTGADTATRLVALAHALRAGDHRRALELCRDQNGAVMQARGGASWTDVGADQRLVVRLRTDGTDLPSLEELPGRWVHPYFLGALKAIAAELSAGGR